MPSIPEVFFRVAFSFFILGLFQIIYKFIYLIYWIIIHGDRDQRNQFINLVCFKGLPICGRNILYRM
jgi:hypothetical protein